MGRLKGISPLLSPDLLHTLCSMGHGDELGNIYRQKRSRLVDFSLLNKRFEKEREGHSPVAIPVCSPTSQLLSAGLFVSRFSVYSRSF